MEITKEIRRELNRTVLRIECSKVYKEDYQIRMLQENEIPGLIGIDGHGIEDKSVYEYEISGKTSLNQRYGKKKINSKEMKKILEEVAILIDELIEHLLLPGGLLLDPEYIYWEKGEFFFCYIPGWEEEISRSFHGLMDSFVQWTDYKDVPSVKLAFLLHKETMEENYSLKKIMETIREQEEQKEKQKKRKEEEPEFTMGTYETSDHDWITHQEMGSQILRETDNMWIPVKRFLQKHKRPKWGEWDGIYIDEGDL